jgi:hypothetical protein
LPIWSSYRHRARTFAFLLGFVLTALVGCGAREQSAQILTPDAVASSVETVTLRGTVQQLGQDEWLVDGMPVALDAQTAIQGLPAVGLAATVRGALGDDGVLLAREIVVDSPPTPSAAPTALPAPTTPPAPAPTNTVAPTAVPAQPAPAEPIAALVLLIETGMADGRAGQEGDDLLKRLRDVEEELAKGKTQSARNKLRDLHQRAAEAGAEGKIELNFSLDIQANVLVIAETYGLQWQQRGGGGRGDDDDDDDDD